MIVERLTVSLVLRAWLPVVRSGSPRWSGSNRKAVGIRHVALQARAGVDEDIHQDVDIIHDSGSETPKISTTPL